MAQRANTAKSIRHTEDHSMTRLADFAVAAGLRVTTAYFPSFVASSSIMSTQRVA